jgi:uncharacterized protein YcbK (DUF882 family)
MNHVLRWLITPLFLTLMALNANANAERANGLHPRLVSLLRQIEGHFHRPLTVTSGCRSRAHNRHIGGARESWHLKCMAADVKVAGVNKNTVAKFARGMAGRGGLGCYCHDQSIHIDLGPRREWYWGCAGQRQFKQGKFHRSSFRMKHKRFKRRH